MKNPNIPFFVILLTVIASATAETKTYHIQFNEKDFMFSYNENNELIIETTDLSSFYLETNKPGIPFFSVNIATSPNNEYESSSFTYSSRLLKSDVNIAPNPLPIITASPTQSPMSHVYAPGIESIYPTSICSFTNRTTFGGVGILHFKVSPFIYDIEQRNLYFIESLDLSITSRSNIQKPVKKYPTHEKEILKALVKNPDEVDSVYESFELSIPRISDDVEYLIVTNENLKSAFHPLLQWKKAKGLKSKIITVEEIQKNCPGENAPVKIKRYLEQLYSTSQLTYVLLGGDDTVVPVMGCYGESGSSYKDNTIPTDLFYACLEGQFNWDGNGNGIYGETDDNIDLSQSIYICRVPVRTVTDTESFINKLIAYEQNGPANINMLMGGTKLWRMMQGTNQSDTEAKAENLYSNFIAPYWNGSMFRFFDTHTDFPGGAGYDFTAENLFERIGSGYSFIDIATHGTQTGWQMEDRGFYASSHGIRQDNLSFSIVTTMACSTNAFDSANGAFDPCLSESLIRNPSSGVIAYLGSSRYGWGYGGNDKDGGTATLGPSLQYESLFYKTLFSSAVTENKYGIIAAATKTAMASKCMVYGSQRWLQFSLNPIGDPEMTIFTTIPKRFNESFIDYANHAIIIESGVENCTICIMSYDDDGESYYKKFNNVKTLSLSDLPTISSVCISKPGFLPKQYTIRLMQNETITGENVYDYDVVILGSSLTTQKTEGPVIIKEGNTSINAHNIIIDTNAIVEKGAILNLNYKY